MGLFAFLLLQETKAQAPAADGRRDGAGESCARGSSADLAGKYVSGQSGLTTRRRCDFCQFDYLLLSVIWMMRSVCLSTDLHCCGQLHWYIWDIMRRFY